MFSGFYLTAQTTPGEYTVKNLDINTKESDFGTAFLGKDKVIFAAPTTNTMIVKKTWKENGQQFLDMYTGLITSDRQLIEKKRMPGDVNTKYHEGGVAVSKDLETIYFTANNFYEKKFLTDSSGVNNLQMFRATLGIDGKWTEKEKLPFNHVEYSIGHPALNHDDTKLYFVSDTQSRGKEAGVGRCCLEGRTRRLRLSQCSHLCHPLGSCKRLRTRNTRCQTF